MAVTSPDSSFDLLPTSSPSLASPTPSPDAPRSSPIRKAFRRFRPPRRLKFTREGKYFIGITFGVGFAAINTGNNLLYLLLGMLLALIVVSGILSEFALRHLTVTRKLPPRAQAGRAHLVEIEVHNRKKRFSSYAIEIEDLREGQPSDKRCFFLKVAPNTRQIAAYRRTPERRGKDRHVGFRIATRFPFGLFEKSREIAVPGEVIVYPAIDPVWLPPRPGGAQHGDALVLAQGHGDEILGLRAMRDGDDPRDIYWRKSTLTPVLRERAREGSPDVKFTLDLHVPAATEAQRARFERRIREIASRAVAHLKRGEAVTLTTSAGEVIRADRSSGADPLLRFLALVEPIDSPARPPSAEAAVPSANLANARGGAG